MTREITTFLFYSLSKNVLPTFDIAKRKRLFSITASPPNGQFHGWKTPPETFMNRYFRIAGTFSPDFLFSYPISLTPSYILFYRYETTINGKPPFIELSPNRSPLRRQSIIMSQEKENNIKTNKSISQQYRESSDSEDNCCFTQMPDNSDMFSSQSQKTVSSQSQTPTSIQRLLSPTNQTPMTEREKELDDQFEVISFISFVNI